MYKKTLVLLSIIIATICVLYSEGQIDPDFVQRHYAFEDFDSLSINGSFRVRVIKSETWDIHISCAREDLNNIKLRNNSNIFEISMKEDRNFALQSPVIIISMPQLIGIELSGTVQMEAGGFTSPAELNVVLERGSFLNLSGFECSVVTFTLNGPCKLHAFMSADSINILSSGSSIVRMGGRAENLLIESSGPAKIDGSLLLVDNVDLQLIGLSEIRITPDILMKIQSEDEALIYYSDKYMDEPPVIIGNAILRKY